MGGAWANPAYAPVSLNRLVFGEYDSHYFGIPLIMDILEEHGFRATFFAEVFCAYILGYEKVEKVFRTIADRGHDAQLHVHPIYRFYRDRLAGRPAPEMDLMFQLPLEKQRELIREAVSLFRELSGRAPRAFRAGCYGASEITLTALREDGIEIDSSYNLTYLGSSCGFKVQPLNAPRMLEGVWEFPVTVFRLPGSSKWKPLEISAVSVGEILATIRCLQEAGARDVVLVLHSFSLLKNLGLRCDHYRPDNIVIHRLRKLCVMLSHLREEVEVGVLGEANLHSTDPQQPQMVPSIGCLRPAMRKIVQGVNRLPWL
jgi:peptidoglycan/xylan/chitin deacetylase (PgdA/CDA1 family)